MKNTFKILFEFNSKIKIVLLFFFSITLSILEALGFAVLAPFISFIVDLDQNTNLSTNQSSIFKNIIINIFNISDQYVFLKIYVIIIIAYYSFKFLFTILANIFNSYFVYEFRDKLQKKILSNFIYKPYEFHLENASSFKVRFTSDEVTNYFNQIIIPSIFLTAEIFIIISLSFFALFYSPTFFLFFLLFSILCFIIVQIVRKILKKIGKLRLLNELNRHQILQQIFVGIKDIIIFSKQEELLKENFNLTKKISKSDKIYLILESFPRHLIELITVFIFCLLFTYLFNYQNFNLKSVLPQIAIYALIFFRILPSLTRIARGVSAMSYAKQIENKLVEYIFDQNEISRPKKYFDFNKSIKIKNLEYKYKGGQNIIKYNSEILIKKGSFNCIIGESGVGKTTLFDLLIGLLEPKNIEIYIDDKKVDNTPFAINGKLGIVHQNIFLFNDTLIKNITFLENKNINKKLVKDIIEIVLLKDFVKNLPNGLDTNIGEIGNKISGGQRQRIAIARALYQNPDFILFDEATSALDDFTEKNLLNNLKKYFRNQKTFVLISHKTRDKDIFDSIIEIKK